MVAFEEFLEAGEAAAVLGRAVACAIVEVGREFGGGFFFASLNEVLDDDAVTPVACGIVEVLELGDVF